MEFLRSMHKKQIRLVDFGERNYVAEIKRQQEDYEKSIPFEIGTI